MPIIKNVMNAFKHVGAGSNLNFFTMVRNGSAYYLRKDGRAKSPLTIFLSVNSVCNLRCKMCDIGQKNKNSSFYKNLALEGENDSLEFRRIERLIKEVSVYKPSPRISVTTTEPFLYKDIFNIANASHSNGMEFQVTTNGANLFTKIEQIVESKIKELCLSIDGPEDLHDTIRGKKGLYSSIIRSLEKLRRLKKEGKNIPIITIATVVSNFNAHRVAELFESLHDSLYDRAIVSHMNFMNSQMVRQHNDKFDFVGLAQMAGLPGETDNYRVDIEALWENIEQIKSTTKKVHFAPDYTFNDLKTFYEKTDRFVWLNNCYIPWFVTEILSNGDVIPMTRCIHIKMGNIYEQSFDDIWNGERYRKFRKELQTYKRFPICRRCRGIL